MSATQPAFDTPEALLELLARRGGDAYFGEPVTVLEHSLQAAFFAREAFIASEPTSSRTLIVAALLHDVGHLLHESGEDVADRGVDTRHEELADSLLAAHLPPAVTEPIRLHVAAKRYLCSADSGYREALSPSSLLSLGLQGGPMSAEEAGTFRALPFAQDAIALRHWDDEAKVPSLAVPDVYAYLPLLKTLWR